MQRKKPKRSKIGRKPFEKELSKEDKFHQFMERATYDLQTLRIQMNSVEHALKDMKMPEPESVNVEKLVKFASPYKEEFGCPDVRCYSCDIPQRNSCWKQISKMDKKKRLAGGIPYDEGILMEMKRFELSSLAGILGINPFKLDDKTSIGLIRAITLKQEAVMQAFEKGVNHEIGSA